jgi:hypothetical protein
LRVVSLTDENENHEVAKSGRVVLARMIAPASRSLRTTTASVSGVVADRARAERRRDPARLHAVLDQHRHAVERARELSGARERLVERSRLLGGPLVDREDRGELRPASVVGLDPLAVGVDEPSGRDVARPHPGVDRVDRRLLEDGHLSGPSPGR